MIAIFLKMGYDSSFRHLAVEVGGSKRLYSMISILSALFLLPLATLFLILSSVSVNQIIISSRRFFLNSNSEKKSAYFEIMF